MANKQSIRKELMAHKILIEGVPYIVIHGSSCNSITAMIHVLDCLFE